MKNEINMFLYVLNQKSNQKLKCEEDILDELKKQLSANKYCVQINNKISELKIQNKEHVLFILQMGYIVYSKLYLILNLGINISRDREQFISSFIKTRTISYYHI